MAEFNKEEAQRFQDHILDRIRELERMIDRDVTGYYRSDRVDDENDCYENLRGLHKYLRDAYHRLGEILNDIERRM